MLANSSGGIVPSRGRDAPWIAIASIAEETCCAQPPTGSDPLISSDLCKQLTSRHTCPLIHYRCERQNALRLPSHFRGFLADRVATGASVIGCYLDGM